MKSIQLQLQDIYTFILGSPFVSCFKSTNDTESNLKLQAKHTIRKVSRSPPKSRKLETNHRSHRLGLRNCVLGRRCDIIGVVWTVDVDTACRQSSLTSSSALR